jgi:hypothetical protein
MIAAERPSPPVVDGSDDRGRLETDREFAMPAGRRTLSFEPIDPTLHSVTLLVVVPVELRRPPEDFKSVRRS